MSKMDLVFLDAGVFIGALLSGDPRHTEARPIVEAARRRAGISARWNYNCWALCYSLSLFNSATNCKLKCFDISQKFTVTICCYCCSIISFLEIFIGNV